MGSGVHVCGMRPAVKYSTCQIVPICRPQHALSPETHIPRYCQMLLTRTHIQRSKHHEKSTSHQNRYGWISSWKRGGICSFSPLQFRLFALPQWCVTHYWHLLTFSCFSGLLIKVKLWEKHRWVKWSMGFSIDARPCRLWGLWWCARLSWLGCIIEVVCVVNAIERKGSTE